MNLCFHNIIPIINLLKVNKTIKSLNLFGKINFVLRPTITTLTVSFLKLKIANEIDDQGIEMLSKALEMNTTLNHINIGC